MAAAARRRPVTLRDFLELGCDSSSDGFRSYPRCLPWTDDDALHPPPPRRLLTTNNGDASLRRSPSRSPSFLFSLARSPGGGPGALARISSLSRSFSRRIRDGFSWRRREDDEYDDDLYDFVDDRDSCGFPSPLVSSCSASDSETEEYDEADVLGIDNKMAVYQPAPASECDKPSASSSSSSSSSADHDGAAADGNKMQADPAVGHSKLGMEDKQQLSPVSVLDFPFDDDDADERSDAGTCSPSFHRCPPPPHDLLHTRTTTQAQLVHKIRRYDGIAQAVDPVDLDARFTTTSDSGESADASTHLATTTSSFTHTATSSSTTTAAAAPRHGDEHQSVDQQEEPVECRLLARLLQDDDTAADEVSQELLLDFFAEGIDRLGPSLDGRDKAEAALVRAAAEWLRGAGLGWGIRDVMLSGKAALEDMERGRRWMCVADEERDVGTEVEGLVIDGLVDELVAELMPCWHGDGRRWSS
ncbi:unnamed protein product [Urochloa humidicola]